MGCDIHLYVETFDPIKGCWVFCPDVEYDWRNYDAFAILADVRNGSGFAGCKTGDGFVPISDQKGVPTDMSNEVRSSAEHWRGYGHSFSWLTLEELLAYDWTQTTTKQGMVDKEAAQRFRETGELPNSWCGWTNAPGYETIRWPITYKDAAGAFYTKTLPELQKLADEHGGPKNVRIVFWFDN